MKLDCSLNYYRKLHLVICLAGLSAVLCQADEPAIVNSSTNNISAAKPATVSIKEYLKSPATFAGRTIILKGFVTDVCRRKGCWALLHDEDSKINGRVRVKQDEAGGNFKPFSLELQGRTILVTGEVRETKIDKAYLDQWENRVKSAQEPAEKNTAAETAACEDTLKQIATFRERLTNSEQSSLISYSFAVQQWQEAEPKK